MKTSDFYYDLPKELIAQDPLEDRSASRLMHLNKETGEYEHGHFRDILKYLKPVSYTHLHAEHARHDTADGDGLVIGAEIRCDGVSVF